MRLRIGRTWFTLPGDDATVHVYVGQATYTDDEGREVEHDWVRLVPVGGGPEVWADPATLTRFTPAVPRRAVAA